MLPCRPPPRKVTGRGCSGGNITGPSPRAEVGRVGPVDVLAVAQEDAQHEAGPRRVPETTVPVRNRKARPGPSAPCRPRSGQRHVRHGHPPLLPGLAGPPAAGIVVWGPNRAGSRLIAIAEGGTAREQMGHRGQSSGPFSDRLLKALLPARRATNRPALRGNPSRRRERRGDGARQQVGQAAGARARAAACLPAGVR